MPKLSTSQVVF